MTVASRRELLLLLPHMLKGAACTAFPRCQENRPCMAQLSHHSRLTLSCNVQNRSVTIMAIHHCLPPCFAHTCAAGLAAVPWSGMCAQLHKLQAADSSHTKHHPKRLGLLLHTKTQALATTLIWKQGACIDRTAVHKPS
jgi:hypothetical protein